jgi:hypothetical protein
MLRIAAVLSLLLVPVLPAQVAAKPDALGIWRASLDGVPSAILTLADDSGAIGGTLILYGIDNDTKKPVVVEAHTLVHPKLAGDTLTFEVRRPDAALMSFTVRFNAAKAQLHCTTCGGDAPTAELAKEHL